jgi:hypothetical protein
MWDFVVDKLALGKDASSSVFPITIIPPWLHTLFLGGE